jgi:hypothetical protein
MSDMIEERYVGGQDGKVTRIWIEPDHDTKPTDFDCYSAADIAAWRHDEWRYVGVLVSDEDTGGRASLWGVEYGLTLENGLVIGMDQIVESYLNDLRSELTAQ